MMRAVPMPSRFAPTSFVAHITCTRWKRARQYGTHDSLVAENMWCMMHSEKKIKVGVCSFCRNAGWSYKFTLCSKLNIKSGLYHPSLFVLCSLGYTKQRTSFAFRNPSEALYPRCQCTLRYVRIYLLLNLKLHNSYAQISPATSSKSAVQWHYGYICIRHMYMYITYNIINTSMKKCRLNRMVLKNFFFISIQ